MQLFVYFFQLRKHPKNIMYITISFVIKMKSLTILILILASAWLQTTWTTASKTWKMKRITIVMTESLPYLFWTEFKNLQGEEAVKYMSMEVSN